MLIQSFNFSGSNILSTYMIGLLPRVYAQVALQRLEVTEACSTDLAWVWLLTRVDQHVGAEVSDLTCAQKTNKQTKR